MISFNYYQYKGCVRNDVPYFYPLNIFIYTMNCILDLPCIALLRLWMWNYPIDDPENGIQGDFYIGYILKWYHFCQVQSDLANYPHFQSDRISVWIVALTTKSWWVFWQVKNFFTWQNWIIRNWWTESFGWPVITIRYCRHDRNFRRYSE